MIYPLNMESVLIGGVVKPPADLKYLASLRCKYCAYYSSGAFSGLVIAANDILGNPVNTTGA